MNEKKLPKAIFQGEIKIGNGVLPCAVLKDGTRILNQAGFLRAIGRSRSPKARHGVTVAETPTFLSANNLKPFINNELLESTKAIKYIDSNNRTSYGYHAEILPQVCEVFLEARDKGELKSNQEHIAIQCDILIRGLARVGIIALVDEATGYQDVRDRLALAKILDKYILDEYRRWTRTFPPEFYKEMFKLKKWPYDEKQIKRPSVIGHYTNNIVYKRLAPAVLKELQRKNPTTEKGFRKQRHHQWLSDNIGIPKLKDHLTGLIALMKAAPNWRQFEAMVNRVYPKYGDTIPMDFEEEN